MKLAILLLSVIATGCASISSNRSQAVWIRSEPPGADIDLGHGVIGQTPAYVVVPRAAHPQVTLTRDGIVKHVELPTTYRWRASFFSNMVFYVLAPIGWGIDLLDGRAWNPEDPPITSVRKPGDRRTYPLAPIARVAIEPPLADSTTLSNSAVPVLQRAIAQKNPKYTVAPYDLTLNDFLRHGYDYDGTGDYNDKRNVYETTAVDGVWKSSFKSTSRGLELEASLEDIRTQKNVDQVHVVVDAPDSFSRTYQRARGLIGLPNALTIASTTNSMTYDRGPIFGTVNLNPDFSGDFLQQSLNVLSALNITNIPAYRAGRSGRWMFSFYPALKISHRDFIASGEPDIDKQLYSRWLGAVGAGPELGYQFGRNYLYFNFFYNAVYTDIHWNYGGREGSVTNWTGSGSAEFGYLYSFSETWSARVFVNSFTEDGTAWRQAIASTSAFGNQIPDLGNSPTNLLSGLAVSYSFEPLLTRGFVEKK